MPLEVLFQTVLGLAHILFLAHSAGYTVDQDVTVACHIVFLAVFTASNSCHNVDFGVQPRAIWALTVGACGVDPLVGSLSSMVGEL